VKCFELAEESALLNRAEAFSNANDGVLLN